MTQEITLPVAELKQALPGLGKLVSKSRSLPVLQSVRVQRDAQGIVTIEGTDLEAHVTYRLKDAQPGKPAEVLVPFDALTKTAKGSSPTVTLIPDGKDKVLLRHFITNSPVEQRITCPETNEWPPAPKITGSPVALDPHFGGTLKEALQCASDDSSRQVLHGACLDVTDPKAHYVVATNGRILFAANSFAFDLKQSVIIPDSKFLSWNGFATDDGCQLAVQKGLKGDPAGWVQLRTPRWTFTARQIESNYPDWKNALPKLTGQATTLKLCPEAIAQIMEVAPQLPGSDNKNRPVRLSVEKGQLQLEGREQDEGAWTPILIEGVTVEGPDIEVSLNRELLLQALRYGLNQIDLENPDGVVLFSQGGRKCAVKLLTPTPPPATPSTTATDTNQSTPQSAEAAAPAPPSAGQSESTPTVERNPMPETTLTPPRRGNLQPTTSAGNGQPAATPLAAAVTQIETVKTGLRDIIADLNTTLDLLRAAEKEKKTSSKEVESVRATLRSLQKVAI